MSRRRKWLVIGAAAFAAGLGTFCVLSYESTPWFLAARPVDEGYVGSCRAAAGRNEPWTRSACQVALFYEDRGASDTRPARSRNVSVRFVSADSAVVSIHDKGCFDDSIHETYSRTHLRLEKGGWVPIKRECARKGRGRWGWTTKATR